jgi:hypothetical protein
MLTPTEKCDPANIVPPANSIKANNFDFISFLPPAPLGASGVPTLNY